MAYTPQTWVNGAGGNTPVNATRLGVMEAGIEDADNRLTVVETQVIVNSQTGSYTLVLADAGKIVEVNAAGSSNITVPPNSSVAFPVGAIIGVSQYGAGAVVIVPGGGVTVRSRNNLTTIGGRYGEVTLRKRATDEWVLVGDLV